MRHRLLTDKFVNIKKMNNIGPTAVALAKRTSIGETDNISKPLFLYHSRTVLSVCGYAWYLVRNLRCTVTTDSVLANSKTQKAFLSLVLVMFRHDGP
jgi:hypothetical protein